MNFALMMTGVGEINALPRLAAGATELKNAATTATELKNAATAVHDVALGVQGKGELERFASSVKAVSFKQWDKLGLYSSSVPAERFDIAFEQVMNRTVATGGRVHFNLTGLDVADALAGNPAERVGRYTAWELQQISGNAAWLKNTIFYQNGKELTQTAVKALGIGGSR
jgi:hypothetical protein